MNNRKRMTYKAFSRISKRYIATSYGEYVIGNYKAQWFWVKK